MNTKFIYLLSAILLLFVLISCNRDSSDTSSSNTYPKTVNVQYRLTSTSSFTDGVLVYINETGGNTSLTNLSLPFSKTFTRTVNKGDYLNLSGNFMGNGTIKAEILVDNTVVLTKDFSGNSVVVVNLTHYFQ